MSKIKVIVYPRDNDRAKEVLNALRDLKDIEIYEFINHSEKYLDQLNDFILDNFISIVYPTDEKCYKYLVDNAELLKCPIAIDRCAFKNLKSIDNKDNINNSIFGVNPHIDSIYYGPLDSINENTPSWKDYIMESIVYLDKIYFYNIRTNNSSLVENDFYLSCGWDKVISSVSKELYSQGCWTFYLRKYSDNSLRITKISSMIDESSYLTRLQGTNLVFNSILVALGIEPQIIKNDFDVNLVNGKFNINIDYKKVYIDFDDTILCDNKINTDAIKFIYQCINERKEVNILTRNKSMSREYLIKYKLDPNIFEYIHIAEDGEGKSKYITWYGSPIFIDNDFNERLEVLTNAKIPVFDVNVIPMLIKER